MTMKDIHGVECPRCKIRNQYYEEFNSDLKKNVSYFGIISYINHYLVMPVSDKPKEFPENDQNYEKSNICYIQITNEWTVRDMIAKSIKQKNGLVKNHLKGKKDLFPRCFKEKNGKSGPKPSFYLPEHTGNLITIKKSESFTGSSSEDTVCSDNLKTAKVLHKCKSTKKSSSKEKIAPTKPKVGTLKRKRWIWENLKSNESYEDNLYEAKRPKQVMSDDSSNSEEEEKITTPMWSVPMSPPESCRSLSNGDCCSATELQNLRKEAEEYHYRRNKGINYTSVVKKDASKVIIGRNKDTDETLMKAHDRLMTLLQPHKEEDSTSDDYFTDSDH